MFSHLRSKLGLIKVSSTPKYITVEGVNTYNLLRDIQRLWGSKAIANNMFSNISSGQVRFLHFFGLDFMYMCEQLYAESHTRLPRRTLRRILDELKENTWLGDIDKDVHSITDTSHINTYFPFPLKPFQSEFVRHFGKVVPAYHLRGYMLDAGAGSGKTATDLLLGECLHADKVVVISPNNAVERVWEDTIANLILKKRPYWHSRMTTPPPVDCHYYVIHYEYLGNFLEFMKANLRHFKNTFVVLDESHNFNRIAADRTQFLIEMCRLPVVSYCLWASGTPILALGVECIPFLRCVDPTFTDEAEERFRKIYGRDAKRANDILRNRIGHLKYHVPKQDVVDVKVTMNQVKVAMPDGEKFTLDAISQVLRKFIDERTVYYEKHYKTFESQYKEGIAHFEQTLRTDIDKRQYKEYQAAFKTVSSGFDPKLMKAEAMLCNKYELKTIIPTLPNSMKPTFKSARSVIKYVKLKIMGEALGGIIGKARSDCNLAMLAYIDFSKYIDDAKKKTLVFTSYVEVLESCADLLYHKGYTPAKVYGATNKDLAAIVKKFYDDEDLNPLIATYQSLSTAVPLTVANCLLLLNQPFRDAIKTQTIARAARLGQDESVDVFDFLLDTGDKPNISTRSNDILEWSANMVAQIVGVTNLDLDTLTLEAKGYVVEENSHWLDAIAFESGEVLEDERRDLINILEAEDFALESSEKSESIMEKHDLPPFLYHGSAYRQSQIEPGFNHSGELVKWDNSEDNTWLYATDDREDAIMLGISSAIEKSFKLDRYSYDEKKRTIRIEVSEPLTVKDIKGLHVVLYTIKADPKDGWMANHNPTNGIKGEFKTQRIIKDNLVKCEDVDVGRALLGIKIEIVYGEVSTEGLSDVIASVKKLFGVKSSEEKRKENHGKLAAADRYDHVFKDVGPYLDQYFGNSSWLSKQVFNDMVSGGGITQPLSVGGKFLNSVAEVGKAADETHQFFGTYNRKLAETSSKVKAIYERCQGPILKAIAADNKDEFEKLMKAAINEFDKTPVTAVPFGQLKTIGGKTISCKPDSKALYDYAISVHEEKVKAGDHIPAMKSDEILAAVKLIKHLVDTTNQKHNAPFLDFEDGSEFSKKIHEYDESLYMDFYDKFYYQTVDNNLTWEMPHYPSLVKDVVIALLQWMDRSIKGEAK